MIEEEPEMDPVEQETQQQPDTSRGDLAISFVLSTLLNLGYIFVAPSDQRVLLLLMFSVIAGLVMLAGDKSGPYGMGIILGAAAATAIAVGCALAGMSPLDHPDPTNNQPRSSGPFGMNCSAMCSQAVSINVTRSIRIAF